MLHAIRVMFVELLQHSSRDFLGLKFQVGLFLEPASPYVTI